MTRLPSAPTPPSVPTLPTAPTLLAVAHGTRDAEGVGTTEALLARVRALRPELRVERCFLDIVSPSLPEALAGLRGEVVLVPLLLGAGYHVRVDIPAALTDAPHLRARVARALGPDPLLAEALTDRLDEAGWHAQAPPSALVLAAAGSTDPAANADTVAMAGLLRERLLRARPPREPRPGAEGVAVTVAGSVAGSGGVDGTVRVGGAVGVAGAGGVAGLGGAAVGPASVGPASVGPDVVPAYLCAAGPTPAEAVAALRAKGHERVAVAEYLLGPGFFARRAARSGACLTSAPLGAHDALARLITLRYDEAVADRRRGPLRGRTGAHSGRMLTPG